MSNLTGNKIAAAGLLAVLLFFSTKTLIHKLSHESPHGSEHGSEKYAYSIEIAEPSQKQGNAEEIQIDLGELLASADPARGQVVSKKCAACHTFNKGGKTLTGPNLWNVIGRMAASESGFNYSSAMKDFAQKWTYENLFYYLENPRKYLKGTAMSFAGIKKEKDRAALLAYLHTLADQPVPFPEPNPKQYEEQDAAQADSEAPQTNEASPEEQNQVTESPH